MMSRLIALCTVFAIGGLLMVAPTASAGNSPETVIAQVSPDRAFTAARPPAGPTAAPPGLFAAAFNWLLTEQQRLNRELATAVKDLKQSGSVTAALILGFVGFSYGVLHAAGPGHGKAVISSYVLANRETVRRGIMLSFLSAFVQALSAIVLVGVLFIVLNKTSMEMNAAERWIETVSWAFVAAVGAWLLYSQIRKIWARRSPTAPLVKTHTHARTPRPASAEHTHHHHANDGCCDHTHHAHPHAGHHDGHGDHALSDHVHGDDCGCGHAHMPDPKDLQGDLTWSKALAIAFSVGIRPCTGAILILVFALSQGLLWAGIYATFAMAIGTAITVSVLAAMAVGSRDLAARFGGEGSSWATLVADGAGLLGATLVLLMGVVFFVGSLQPQAPF